MTDHAQKTAKDWQNTADLGCDLPGDRSQQDAEESRNGCDHSEGIENTSIQPVKPLSKNAEWAARRSQQNKVYLTGEKVAALTDVSGQLVRRNAAESKYPGAYKTPLNGIEVWMIPLDALPALAQALYWHEKQTAAGLTKNLFEGGTSFTDPEEREQHWKQYEQATEKLQGQEARRRFATLLRFEELLRQGMGKYKAYAVLRREFDVARSTFNLWQESVDGLDKSDWLPALVPDYVRRSNARRVSWPGESWVYFLNHATTPGADLATAYKRTLREAAAQGWGDLPSLTTARLDFRQLDQAAVTLLREGPTALKALPVLLIEVDGSWKSRKKMMEAIVGGIRKQGISCPWEEPEQGILEAILYGGLIIFDQAHRLSATRMDKLCIFPDKHSIGIAFMGKIRLIQTAKGQLRMVAADYRALLLRAAGVSSSKEIRLSRFDAVMSEFRRLGFADAPAKRKPKPAPAAGWVHGLEWREGQGLRLYGP